MAQRTQISLPPDDHRRARLRATEQGISLAEYVRRLVARDLAGEPSPASPAALFDLGDSGGSDVAADGDAYLGDALAAEHSRDARR